jgi:hypothetical protein
LIFDHEVAFYGAAHRVQNLFPLRERGGYLWFAHLQRMRHWQFRLSDFLDAPFAQEKRESYGAMRPSINLIIRTRTTGTSMRLIKVAARQERRLPLTGELERYFIVAGS